MMNELRLEYPIPFMSRVFDVSASGYFAWVSRPASAHAKEEARLEVEIQAAHERTRGTYGAERLQKDLAAHGVKAGVSRMKGYAGNWGYGANKSGGSRSQRTRGIRYLWRTICYSKTLRRRHRAACGSATSRISRRRKGGYILQRIRTFLRERLSGMRWGRG